MNGLLADIGGTHARFARADGKTFRDPEKLAATDFESLEEALVSYCGRYGMSPGGELRIATAAVPGDDGVWRFHNDNRWVIDRAALAANGWDVDVLVNDFLASARGVLALPEKNLEILKVGTPDPASPRALLGPGTGLGLAFMIPLEDGGWHIQKTFGGHMLAAALTDEQALIMKLVRRLRGGNGVIVPEDMVSGRGLPVLYRAVCLSSGRKPQGDTAEEILALPADPDAARTLRLFHEFLGLFAHQTVVTGHAFGGLYLDGGVLHRLREANLFDFGAFEKFFALEAAQVVTEALANTPVWLVNDPYVALRGILEMRPDA